MTPAELDAAVREAAPDPLATIGVWDIGAIFGRNRWWFTKGAIRARLYAQGFPQPLSRGVWNKRAVVRFALQRSAGMATAPPADDDADLDGAIARTRAHLKGRRHAA